MRRPSSPLGERGVTLDDIAQLYKHAPKMEAPALNTPLPPGASHPTVYIGGEVLIEPSLNELEWALSRSGFR